MAHAVPVEGEGKASWRGPGIRLAFTLCQAMKRVLTATGTPDYWSTRARDEMAHQRDDFSFLRADGTVLARDPEGEYLTWWTSADQQVNALLAVELQRVLVGSIVTANNLKIEINGTFTVTQFSEAIRAIHLHVQSSDFEPPINQAAIDGLKFSECLPPDILLRQLRTRTNDLSSTTLILTQPVHFVIHTAQ